MKKSLTRAVVAVLFMASWSSLFDTRVAQAADRNTTIDPRVQQAATDAVATAPLPTELVAIRASTGAVLAYVSHGPGLAANDALVGRYPPGSTFKIITSAALIAHGSSTESPAPCPASLTIDGETLSTYDGHPDPAVHTLSDAFARSCDTAFAALGAQLSTASLHTTAAHFGLGVGLHLGRPGFAGMVTRPTTGYDLSLIHI